MDQDHSYLKEENDRLRQENEDLRRQLHGYAGGGGPVIVQKSGNKGCTTALLVVAVIFGGLFVFSILAAIGLPMYSVFKQKSKVGVTLKQITGLEQSLIAWHQEYQGFDGLVLERDGAIKSQTSRLGILSPAPGRTWQLEADGDCLQIRFHYGMDGGCPPAMCDGVYQICAEGDSYNVVIEVGQDELGMNNAYQLK